ncbi:hypothetical protein IIC_04476 [Bacillus cereus VD021]|uniref:Uncharacterized protein n=1 Tax=Bacillus cereus VD021 TaxID=1053224 RepID=R8HDP4_BACCE|nr:hypothetical protein IIC_04476 [Bacillus cereus VD021]
MIMHPLIIPVIRYTLKRRSLFEDFAFVCIGYEVFQCLLLYEKHAGEFEIQMN